MKEFALYTFARLWLFLVTFAVMFVLTGLVVSDEFTQLALSALLAAVISAGLAFVLLRSMRERLATRVATGVGSMRERIDQSRRKEDAD